jgi:CubicO group peptidase (beta-lactamase class C family)
MSGTARNRARAVFVCLTLLLTLLGGIATAQEATLEGHWEGAIELPGMELEFDLDFAFEEGTWTGDISIPVQAVKDRALERIELNGDQATFTITEVPGEPTFSGTFSEDGTTLSGDFTQAGQTFPFSISGALKPAVRAAAALEGFAEEVERALTDFELPGLAMAVVVDGEVVLSRGWGVRDLGTGEPVTEDTLFAIGSCTKAFTTMVLGTLVDEGVIEWDEPVITYLPDFRLQDDHATRNLTVRDLVTHRSGLPRHDFLWYNASYTREELVHRLRYLQPFADLRERYHYQNLMFLAAGYLAEQVSGRTWEDLVRERIFTPLGMERSNFSVRDSEVDDDHATPHSERDDLMQTIPFRDITTVGPAGSINSSVAEMARWLMLQLGEGTLDDRQVVQPSTAREMFTPQTVMSGFPTDKDSFLTSYGLGWALTAYRGHYRAHHGGGIDGFVAMTTVMPLDGVGIIALSNSDTTGAAELATRHALDRILELDERDWFGEALERKQKGEEVADQAEEKMEVARKEGTSPSRGLEEYAGDYEHPGYGLVTIELADGALHATYNDITSPLEHWHFDTFNATGESDDPAMKDTKVLFRADVAGEISELVATLDPEVDDIVFAKKPDARLFDPEFLALLAGSYVFEITEQAMEIVLTGNRLNAVLPGQPTYELEPIRETEFGLKGLTGFSLVFILDGGSVKEIEVRQPNGVFTAIPKREESTE